MSSVVWDMFGEGTQSVQWVVAELTWYLDIFYTDVSGWVKLVDMYAELNLCIQASSACAVLTPGQVHALAAGPRAHAAAHGAEPVLAAFRGDSVHGRGCAPCTQDIPLWVREQWFCPALRRRLTHDAHFQKKKKSASDNVFRTCCNLTTGYISMHVQHVHLVPTKRWAKPLFAHPQRYVLSARGMSPAVYAVSTNAAGTGSAP